MTTTAASPPLAKTTSAKLLAARLPVTLAAAVRRELAPDEVVVWIGRPSPSFLPWRHWKKCVLGVVWTAFFLTYMAWLGATGTLVLALSPFVAIGLIMMVAPWLSTATARQTVYLVTDRRALVIGKGEVGGYPWPAFRLRARSYGHSELHDLRRVDLGTRGFDLVIRQRVEDNDGARTTTDEGFIALSEGAATTAEAALRELRARR